MTRIFQSIVYMAAAILSSSSAAIPSIDLFLTPTFDPQTNAATSIPCRMVISGLTLQSNETFLQLNLLNANVPSNRYDGSALQAVDEDGNLPLYIQDEGATRYWYTSRATKGYINTTFEGFPREITPNTPAGPRVDLLASQGGLLGTGSVFVPVPVDRKAIYENNIHWSLTDAPEGTSVAWTFGDGLSASKRGTPNEVLVNSVYAVGPLKSYVKTSTSDAGEEQVYGFYWFGEPDCFVPEDMSKMLEDLYSKMREFFRDTQTSYRIFAHQQPFRGYGGSAFTRSFILEYSPNLDVTPDEIFLLLSHEMVHNWPLMDGSGHGLVEDETTWYVEGVAEYYMSLLPYRFGIHSKSEYLHNINCLATGYYTNPFINLTNDEGNKKAWEHPMIQSTPYYRGAMHLHEINSKIILKSGGAHSIDNAVLELLRFKESRMPWGLKEWIQLVEQDLGSEANLTYEGMFNGTLIIPGDSLGDADFVMVKEDKYPFELGFDSDSYQNRPTPIQGLVKGSRAEEAGLQNEDVILEASSWSSAVDNYELEIEFLVARNGEKKRTSYWPRGRTKVEAWHWAMKDQEDAEKMEL